MRLVADEFREARIVFVGHFHRRAALSLLVPFVQHHLAPIDLVDAAEPIAHAHRPVHRRSLHAEHALDLVHDLERITAVRVHLVDERQHRQLVAARHGKQLARLFLDALGRVDHHHDAVGREQRTIRVFTEVAVTRRIEQAQPIAVEFEFERGGGQRDATLLLHFHPVRDGRTTLLAATHGARQLDGAGIQQQLLGERGLAGVGMGNDREGAPTGDVGREHGIEFRLGRRSGRVVVHIRMSVRNARTGG